MASLADMCVSVGLPVDERNKALHRRTSVSSPVASESPGQGELAVGSVQYPRGPWVRVHLRVSVHHRPECITLVEGDPGLAKKGWDPKQVHWRVTRQADVMDQRP